MSGSIEEDCWRVLAEGSVTSPVYAILAIVTGAARAEAAALAEDRVRELADQGITVTADLTRPLLQEPGALGLYEDGILIGCCFLLHEHADMRRRGGRGHESGLHVSLDPATLGSDSQVGRLLTLWLADQAARNSLMWVWCEVPSHPGSGNDANEWLLKHLRELGWAPDPAALSSAGNRVTRLRVRAEARAALTAAISVPPTTTFAGARKP